MGTGSRPDVYFNASRVRRRTGRENTMLRASASVFSSRTMFLRRAGQGRARAALFYCRVDSERRNRVADGHMHHNYNIIYGCVCVCACVRTGARIGKKIGRGALRRLSENCVPRTLKSIILPMGVAEGSAFHPITPLYKYVYYRSLKFQTKSNSNVLMIVYIDVLQY